MHFDNSLHQCQADSRTLDRRIELFEQSEDPVVKTGIDSDAIVANGTDDLTAGDTACDLDPRVLFLANELDGIVDQVLKDLEESLAIPKQGRKIFGHDDADSARIDLRLGNLQNLVDQFAHRELLGRIAEPPDSR